MSDIQTKTHDDQLREWARGTLPLEAATELLIRTGFARPKSLWMRYDENKRPWIDFAAIPELIGGKSGGEKRVLRFAASLGADVPVIIGDHVCGVDRDTLALMLVAIAHAGGATSPGRRVEFIDDEPRMVSVGALMEWPALETA